MHGSTTNQTAGTLRLSADVRYQPHADPFDDRWVWDAPVGLCTP